MIKLKRTHTDTGLCRVYFRDVQKPSEVYAMMGVYEFELYACSRDGEPSHEVDMSLFVIPESQAGGELDEAMNDFLRRRKRERSERAGTQNIGMVLA